MWAISPLSAASRSVLAAMSSSAAALVRLNQGSTPSGPGGGWYSMVGSERRHALTCPGVTMANDQLVPVEDCNDQNELSDPKAAIRAITTS